MTEQRKRPRAGGIRRRRVSEQIVRDIARDVDRAERALRREHSPAPVSPHSPFGEPDHLLAACEYLEMVGRRRPRPVITVTPWQLTRAGRGQSIVTVRARRGSTILVLLAPDDCLAGSERSEDVFVVAVQPARYRPKTNARDRVRDIPMSEHVTVALPETLPPGSYRLYAIAMSDTKATERLAALTVSTEQPYDRGELTRCILDLHVLPAKAVGITRTHFVVPLKRC